MAYVYGYRDSDKERVLEAAGRLGHDRKQVDERAWRNATNNAQSGQARGKRQRAHNATTAGETNLIRTPVLRGSATAEVRIRKEIASLEDRQFSTASRRNASEVENGSGVERVP